MRTCRTCKAPFEPADKPVLNCPACRKAWRESRRKKGGRFTVMLSALESIARSSRDEVSRATARRALEKANADPAK